MSSPVTASDVKANVLVSLALIVFICTGEMFAAQQVRDLSDSRKRCAQGIWSLEALAGVSMGLVFITVRGQCMGDKEVTVAEYYFRKLTKWTLFLSAAWNPFGVI